MRFLKYGDAIREALDQCLETDPRTYLMGLGVPDPKGIFGTTLGLQEKYGARRVMDMPTAENGMTGIAIGSALAGMRPIMVHQRIDFALLAIDQIINNAAKWCYMSGGAANIPLVIRLIIGRGWGQGPQHAQSMQSLFAHIPGLKVVMPAMPYDAKGLLIAAVRDGNPVIYLEHRWLHGITGPVPEEAYTVPIGKARVVKEGKDLTIVANSYMTVESLRAADYLSKDGIDAEVIDLRSLKPLDSESIIESVAKTGRVVVVDGAWRTGSFAAEVIATIVENPSVVLKCNPRRITFPDVPSPSTPALAKYFYPRVIDIVNAVRGSLGQAAIPEEALGPLSKHFDVPDNSFSGPF